MVFLLSVLVSIHLTEQEEKLSNKDPKTFAPEKIGHPNLMSPHSNPILFYRNQVFVANTAADTVDIIDANSSKVIDRIKVGVDPVSLALRPDGKELWVANHISDTINVIDLNSKSQTYRSVVATIQDLDLKTRSTRFDEPVGIAFADNRKAYVALSSENKIAVIDVAERSVYKYLPIPAQDPRAIKVRNGKLYVIPFESNNKTQLSGGKKIDGNLVTFDAYEHSIKVNNILSLGHKVDIVKHPNVPDKDLFIYDTKTDKLIKNLSTLGTLLYGMTVDSKGNIFIAQTDARNEVNGRSGTKKHGLAEMENRAFLNQITKVDSEGKKSFINLEPLPPKHPKPEDAFATPFAIEISSDDKVIYSTAAGSDKFFSVDSVSGKVLSEVKVDSVPRGIALSEKRAWVFNAVANTVSQVDISNPQELKVISKTILKDPTPEIFKKGRVAFNTARASSTGTFSCASCHPDGHTDQLLWVLNTPIVTGGKQIQPRSTMPIRGLRDTAPFHWDGIPGDPYGGNNSASIHKSVKPNSDIKNPESAARNLIDGGLANTMKMVSDKTMNDEGMAGYLSKEERDDLASFILSVAYPPAPKRAYNNELSERAVQGFELFHLKGNLEGKPKPNVCGDCHRMPFLVSTNTPGSGMDAPTWRGAYDRFLILPQGRLNIIEFDFYKRIADKGIPERDMWRLTWKGKQRFDPVWEMVLEGSTGFSGSFARQVTLNKHSIRQNITKDLILALEKSAKEKAVVLEVDAIFTGTATKKVLQFRAGKYESSDTSLSREQIFSLAESGKLIGTFTGRHGNNVGIDDIQPALWTLGPIHAQRGKQKFPVINNKNRMMVLSGRHIQEGARIIVNGRRTEGKIALKEKERVEIYLAQTPKEGIHFLQIQNPNGLFSNDFIFHVSSKVELSQENNKDIQGQFVNAIVQGRLEDVKNLANKGASLKAAFGNDLMPPLGMASFHGHASIVKYLIEKGANVSQTNKDGNSALHVAAFMCHKDVVKILMSNGASLKIKNKKGERALDTVSGKWSEELGKFYVFLNSIVTTKKKIEAYRTLRPEILKILNR